MITIAFDPAIIWLNQWADVDLVLVNSGAGPCTQISFYLEKPRQLTFVSGSESVFIGRVEHTKPYREPMTLIATEEGVINLRATELRCCNPFGEYEEFGDQVLTLTVL